MDDNADAKRILLASAPADWRRQLGRPRITWLSTIQQDLKHHHLTLSEAADLAQNRPLWRMMSTYGATQSWVACHKRRRRSQIRHAQWQRLDQMIMFTEKMPHISSSHQITTLYNSRKCESSVSNRNTYSCTWRESAEYKKRVTSGSYFFNDSWSSEYFSFSSINFAAVSLPSLNS